MRLGILLKAETMHSFNPRTRKGCDGLFLCKLHCLNVSIHAPVKDATSGAYLRNLYFRVSIHAPVKDATISEKQGKYKDKVSIHAPVKDATI